MTTSTSGSSGVFERKAARIVIKVLLVLLAVAAGALFFGICLPFFLLSLEVLPSLGVAGLIYVAGGGLAGMVLAGTTSAVTLARSPRLVTPVYAALLGSLLALIFVYYVAYMNIEALHRHL